MTNDQTHLKTTALPNYQTANGVEPARKPTKVDIELYHRRWYVLLIFFLTGVLQGWLWNTYGPIAVALKFIGWPLRYDAATQVMACLSSSLGAPLCVWIMEKKGLRLAMILSTLLMAIGCSLRCLTSYLPVSAGLTMVGLGISTFAGVVPICAAVTLSSIWFSPKQRWLATAIGFQSTYAGSTIAMLVGPAMIKVPMNATLMMIANETESSFDTTVDEEIMDTMYIQCGIAVWLLIVVLCYFPKKPPKPPCLSAVCVREPLLQGTIEAFKSWKLWLLFLPYGSAAGIYYSWTAVFDVILDPVGISQTDSGWMAFNSSMAGIAAAILVPLLGIVFQRYMKPIGLVLLLMCLASAIGFTLISMGYVPFSYVGLYICSIGAGAFLYPLAPIAFEIASEILYPISENVVCLIMQWWINAYIMFFFLLFLIPSPERGWMNWVVVGCVIASFLSFAVSPTIYGRLSVDEGLTGDETTTDATANHEKLEKQN